MKTTFSIPVGFSFLPWRMTGWTSVVGVSAVVLAATVVAVPRAALGEQGDDGVSLAGLRWSQAIEVASGNAHRGPWRQNDSEFDFVDDAAVAVNDEGFVAVAWADLPTHDIFLQVYGPEGDALLDEPSNISRSPGIFSWIPRLVITNGGSLDEILVHAIWQDIVFRGGGHGGEIFSTSSTDGGQTFGPLVNLSDAIEGSGKGRTDPQRWHNGSYDLFLCPAGVLHAAWTEYEGRLWYSRSTDGGVTFSEKAHITGGGGGDEPLPTRAPSIAADGSGWVVIAHTVGDVTDADIHLWVSADGGAEFSGPVVPHESGGFADAPRVVFDGAGVLHLVYAESLGGPDGAPYVDSDGERQSGAPQLKYTRAAAGGMDFTPARPVFEGEAGDHAAARAFPFLRADARGHLHLAWERFAEFPGRPRGLGYARSEDGGQTFSTPILVPDLGGAAAEGVNGSQQGLLASKLAVSASGRVALANSLFVRGERSEVRVVSAEPGS